MVNLAVWSVAAPDGEGTLQQPAPRRVERSQIDLERHLEDWIANDSTLIAEGLTVVGRQVSIDGGRLDLLAIDSHDRWVVIEIKPGLLDSGALGQALYYASSIAHLDGSELFEKLKPRLSELGDSEMLSDSVKRQLEVDGYDGKEREVAVLLVGSGIDPGLARMNKFLSRFGVPIDVVSFEVFDLNGGPRLLIRDVDEELRHGQTLEAFRNEAVNMGVVEQFDRFVGMSREAGLILVPHTSWVRIAPPEDLRWALMYVEPTRPGGLKIWVRPDVFAMFFPRVTEEQATDALGTYNDGGFVAGEELDQRLDRIEQFLTEIGQRPDDNGG